MEENSNERNDCARGPPPRFTKTTDRGLKRNIDVGDYESERKRQCLVWFTQLCLTFFLHHTRVQTAPSSLIDEVALKIDKALYKAVRSDIASRYLFLKDDQLKHTLNKACSTHDRLKIFPEQHTKFVINVFCSQYFKYYKNIVHKLRYDTRKAIEDVEPVFFEHPKPRKAGTKGRDLAHWYISTESIARKLESVIEHKRSSETIRGFRQDLIKAYEGKSIVFNIHLPITTKTLLTQKRSLCEVEMKPISHHKTFWSWPDNQSVFCGRFLLIQKRISFVGKP